MRSARLLRSAPRSLVALALALAVVGASCSAGAGDATSTPRVDAAGTMPGTTEAPAAGASLPAGSAGSAGEEGQRLADEVRERLARGDTLEQTEQALIDAERGLGGGRAALGDRADEVFAAFDAARLAAAGEVGLAPATVTGTPVAGAGEPADALLAVAMPRAFVPGDESNSLIAKDVMTALAMGADTPDEPSVVRPEETSRKNIDGMDVTEVLTARRDGSRVQLDHTFDMRKQVGDVSYQEGTGIRTDLLACPDVDGNVPISMDVRPSYSFESNGTGATVATGGTVKATAHIGDDARVTGIDFDVQTQTSVRSTDGSVGQYLETSAQYHVPGTEFPRWSLSGYRVIRASRDAGPGNFAAVVAWDVAAVALVSFAVDVGSSLWLNGGCVMIKADDVYTGGGDARTPVPRGSDFAFLATVVHRLEHVELDAPVVATLLSGGLGVTPGAPGLPSPACIDYSAPDEAGAEASVRLETRSRRGVAVLEPIPFRTNDAGYDASAVWGGTRISGRIESLSRAFVLQASDGFEGTLSFTPSSEEEGTWAFSGTWGGSAVSSSSGGTYRTRVGAKHRPTSIVLAPAVWNQTSGDYSWSNKSGDLEISLDALTASGGC